MTTRYDGINFTPPQGVRDACARGLELHKEGHSGEGLKPATVAWARRLAAGEDISPEKAVQMRAWFARHDNDTENAARAKDAKSPAMVAWLLWGGDPGQRWSKRLVGQMEAADETAEEKRMAKGTGPAERRAFSFEIKAIDEAGQFEGYANTYARDAYGDEVQPGAFKRTLDHWKTKGERIPMLSQHNPSNVVGYFEPADCYEDTEGLRVKGQILTATQAGRDHYELAKAGLLKMSIGFDTLQAETDTKTKSRKLIELRLWEISLVTFPANDASKITGIKSADFATILTQQQVEENIYDTRWKMERALSSAIYQAMADDDMTDDDKIAACDASIGQWHQAMLAWLRRALAAGLYSEKGADGPAEIKAGRKFSAASIGSMSAAIADIKSAHDKLSALLGMDDDADEAESKSADGIPAPTPGPSADVARLTSEIKAAAVQTEALMAIRRLSQTMSAK
jgi:HK97 family phage prohead protease